jgi:OOP family OmpA-OmpF porin
MAALDRLLPSLRVLEAAAARGNHIVVSIIGRADAPGTTEYNLRLSEGRAEAVRRYLLMSGVPDSLLRTQGVGAAGSDADHGGEADDAERRVNLVVTGLDMAAALP